MTIYTCHYKARQTTGFVGHLTIEVPAASGRDARLFAGQALSLLVPDSSVWEWSHGSKSNLLETVATLDADQAEAILHAAQDRLVALGVEECRLMPGYYRVGDRVKCKRTGALATVSIVGGHSATFMLEWDNGGAGSYLIEEFEPVPAEANTASGFNQK